MVIFSEIHKEALEQGIILVFVRLPYKNAEDFLTLRAHFEKIASNYVGLVKSDGNYGENIFIPGDGHLNVHGRQYVANALLD